MYHETTYPYVEKQNNYQCQMQTYWNSGAQIVDAYWDYECNDEKMMKLIYEFGAISTGLWASDSGFKFYKSGVFDTCRYFYTITYLKLLILLSNSNIYYVLKYEHFNKSCCCNSWMGN